MFARSQWLLSEATAAMGKTFLRKGKVKKEGEGGENEERWRKERLRIFFLDYMETENINMITCNLISALLDFLLY